MSRSEDPFGLLPDGPPPSRIAIDEPPRCPSCKRSTCARWASHREPCNVGPKAPCPSCEGSGIAAAASRVAVFLRGQTGACAYCLGRGFVAASREG